MFKNIKTLLLVATTIALIAGCDGPPRPGHRPGHRIEHKAQAAKVNADAQKIYVSSKATFAGKQIAQNIKDECSIDSQVMNFIKVYASHNNIDVIVDGKPKSSDTVLKISIIDAISARGAGFGGHNKYIVIKGKLYKGKKLQSSFTAARMSGGGYFGMYRNSCSVLGSCAKTLGRDTASWLVTPTKNAQLGDTFLIQR
jgi:hypothetical protein